MVISLDGAMNMEIERFGDAPSIVKSGKLHTIPNFE